MSIADDLESGPQPQPQSIPEGATGQELALALQESLQAQAQALATLAQNYGAGVNLVADQLAPFFTAAMTGQTLMGAVLNRVGASLTEQKPMAIASQVEPIQMELPKFEPYEPTAAEQRFKQFIGGARRPAILPTFSQGEPS